MRDHFVEIGNVRLHYVEEGDGPLVVLLHGFPEFWYSWRKQIAPLAAAGFRVIAPDLRGYNESSKPEGIDAYAVPEAAKDIAALIVRNGGTCVLVGHDWGGFVAWSLARSHPDLVRKLVVANAPHPAAVAREAKRSLTQRLRLAYTLLFSLPALPEMLLRLALPAFMRRAGRFTADEIAEYKEAWARPGALTGMLNYYRALRRSRRAPQQDPATIDIPTLFIFGEKDPVFQRGSTEGMEKWVPDIRVVYVAHAGHFVQTDAPDRVSALIAEFARQ